jgi:hypothetical protein
MVEKEWKQWEDLPPEEEERLIDSLVKYLTNRKLNTLFRMVLESGGSLTTLFAEFWMGLYGPYFDFFGVDKYGALLRKRKNVERLIAKLEEAEEERKEKRKPEAISPPS